RCGLGSLGGTGSPGLACGGLSDRLRLFWGVYRLVADILRVEVDVVQALRCVKDMHALVQGSSQHGNVILTVRITTQTHQDRGVTLGQRVKDVVCLLHTTLAKDLQQPASYYPQSPLLTGDPLGEVDCLDVLGEFLVQQGSGVLLGDFSGPRKSDRP